MPTKRIVTFILALALLMPVSLYADEATDAQKASDNIMILMSEGKYALVWDNHMSEYFKSTMTRDSFLANLSIGRQMLGKFIEGKLLDQAYSNNDPASGYKGSVYAFNYVNTYSGLKLYERVVVINQDGNGFKLAGFWASPAQ